VAKKCFSPKLYIQFDADFKSGKKVAKNVIQETFEENVLIIEFIYHLSLSLIIFSPFVWQILSSTPIIEENFFRYKNTS
jgi:hypothetical protein